MEVICNEEISILTTQNIVDLKGNNIALDFEKEIEEFKSLVSNCNSENKNELKSSIVLFNEESLPNDQNQAHKSIKLQSLVCHWKGCILPRCSSNSDSKAKIELIFLFNKNQESCKVHQVSILCNSRFIELYQGNEEFEYINTLRGNPLNHPSTLFSFEINITNYVNMKLKFVSIKNIMSECNFIFYFQVFADLAYQKKDSIDEGRLSDAIQESPDIPIIPSINTTLPTSSFSLEHQLLTQFTTYMSTFEKRIFIYIDEKLDNQSKIIESVEFRIRKIEEKLLENT